MRTQGSGKEFWEYCHTDENSDRSASWSFGTNLGLSEMIGYFASGRKFPGALAFGDPYGSQTHANWKSKTHVDVDPQLRRLIDGDRSSKKASTTRST